MADRYLVGLTSAGGDWNDTALWSTSSGGSGGSSVPTSADNVFIDDNSVATGVGSATLAFTGDIHCKDFTSNRPSGVINTIPLRLQSADAINIHGSVFVTQHTTAFSSQSMFFFCGVKLVATSPQTINFGNPTVVQPQTGGSTLGVVFDGVGGEWTLQENFRMSASVTHINIRVINGTVILNGFNLANDSVTAQKIIFEAGTTLDASGGGIVQTGIFEANGTFFSPVTITGGTIAVRAHTTATYAYVTNNIASQQFGTGTLPFVNTDGHDGGGNTQWTFPQPNINLYLQNVFMVGSDTDGKVQTINIGKSDDETPIYYELETQDIEFGNRAHVKKIDNQLAVFTRFGAQSTLQAKTDMFPYKDIPLVLDSRVNIGDKINLEGHYVTFKWFGSSSTTSPVFEGLYIEDVTDQGITHG